jgi:hypothetical protein
MHGVMRESSPYNLYISFEARYSFRRGYENTNFDISPERSAGRDFGPNWYVRAHVRTPPRYGKPDPVRSAASPGHAWNDPRSLSHESSRYARREASDGVAIVPIELRQG